MKILIAPDKYRGTLTSQRAAVVISENIGLPNILLPLADGGEGTAWCVAQSAGWRCIEEGVYVNETLSEAAIDSSALVGHRSFSPDIEPAARSTRALGAKVNEVYANYRPRTIFIGIGGTATCDGGAGFMEELDKKVVWRNVLVGLIDVEVPLLPANGDGFSALMFCPQKGFTSVEISEAERMLRKVMKRYGPGVSRFDGAGGGLGYALATVLGAKCCLGAEWLMNRANINWEEIELVVTGEGKYDAQSSRGKVVSVVAREASRRGIPAVCLAGCVDENASNVEGLEVIDVSKYYSGLPLTSETAAKRLGAAAEDLGKKLKIKLLGDSL